MKKKTKKKRYQQYIQNGRFESDIVFIESLIAELNDLISYRKDLYYGNFAKNNDNNNNPLLQTKRYWSILLSRQNHFITTEKFP